MRPLRRFKCVGAFEVNFRPPVVGRAMLLKFGGGAEVAAARSASAGGSHNGLDEKPVPMKATTPSKGVG